MEIITVIKMSYSPCSHKIYTNLKYCMQASTNSMVPSLHVNLLLCVYYGLHKENFKIELGDVYKA